MPKPTRAQIQEILTRYRADEKAPAWARVVSVDLAHLIDAAWAEDAAERECGRVALEIVQRFARHDPWCAKAAEHRPPCDCGFDAARDALGDASAAVARPEQQAAAVEGEQVERFNETQRAKREAYAAALQETHLLGTSEHHESRRLAAERYPLKRRITRAVADPHAAYFEWRLNGDYIEWREEEGYWRVSSSSETPGMTPDRIRALAALLSDPWEYVEDRTVEEVSDG